MLKFCKFLILSLVFRGNKLDYDEWAEASHSKWNYKSINPYIKKAEKVLDANLTNGATSELHCDKGTTSASTQNIDDILMEQKRVMLEAYQEIGMNILSDPLASYPNGISKGYFLVTDKNRKSSTAEDYLLPCKDRNNLHILKEATVTKILMNENKAAGVTISTKQGEINVFAKEVIVSAGVYNSPQLLMLSGIGPAEDLERLNIPTVQDLPVGYGFQDQVFVPVVITGQSDSGVNSTTNLGTFPVPFVSGSFPSSLGDSAELLDLLHYSLIFSSTPLFFFFMYVNLNFNLEVSKKLYLTQPENERMVILTTLAKPNSTGRVTLRSADPRDPPKIYNNYFAEKSDVDRLVEGVKKVLKIKDTSYFKEVRGNFIRPPLPECDNLPFDTYEYWACYVKNLASTLFHGTSTCAIGKVVDEYLKVKGVKNLRVVDASVMPTVPSTATVIPIIALAEKAADLIKGEYGATEGYKQFPCS